MFKVKYFDFLKFGQIIKKKIQQIFTETQYQRIKN